MEKLTRRGIRFLEAVWLTLNPAASRRDRLRLWAQIKTLRAQRQILKAQRQTLRGQVAALREKIKALQDIPTPDNVIEVNEVDSVNEFYASVEEVEKAYDTERLVIYQLFLDVLAANAEIRKNNRILDAGCGLGIFTRLIKERFDTSDICGFDFSNLAIAQACEQGEGIRFFTHDVYDSLPEQYDVVICMELLEHLINPEVAARNLLDCLSKDGILFMTVPDGRVDRHIRHINFWSPESWDVFLKRLGQGTHDVKVGIVQHPKIKARRYNWAILKRRTKDMRTAGQACSTDMIQR